MGKPKRLSDLVLAATLALVATGCKDTVTGPDLRSPTVTPVSPGLDLRGRWTGFVRDRGATDEYFCPGRQVDADVQISQSGDQVTMTLPLAGCSHGGEAALSATLALTTLSGQANRLESSECPLSGYLQGTAFPHSIVLDGTLGGTCNAVHVHVELTR